MIYIMIPWVVGGLFLSLFSLPLHFLSCQQCSFGAETKISLEKIVFRQTGPRSLAQTSRNLPWLCLVGFLWESAKPANPRSPDQERRSKRLCQDPRQAALHVTLKLIRSSQEPAGRISSAFPSFFFSAWKRLPADLAGQAAQPVVFASHLWKGSFR